MEELYDQWDSGRPPSDDVRVERDLQRFSDLEESIRSRLGDGGSELLRRYQELYDKVQANETAKAFMQGFRCGVRLMAAAFDNESC